MKKSLEVAIKKSAVASITAIAIFSFYHWQQTIKLNINKAGIEINKGIHAFLKKNIAMPAIKALSIRNKAI